MRMDKIKTFISNMDKRVLIGIIAAIIGLIVIIVALVSCGSDNKTGKEPSETKKITEEDSSKKQESTKNDEEKKQDETGTEEGTTEEGTTEEATTEDGITEGSESVNNSHGSTEGSSQNQSQSSSAANNGGSSEQNTTTKPQAGGESGTTHTEFPAEDLSVTTVEIAPGKSVYYDIYRTGGKVLEISSSDAYVVYDGKTYTPQNGVIKIQVEQALASDAVRFEIGNSSSSKKSFRLQFSDPKGTHDNPERMTSLGGTYSTYSASGNELGYNYIYNAEKTGTIVLYVSNVTTNSKNVSAQISVTNSRNSANRTTGADGVDDGQGHTKIELEVQKGDEIRIVIGVQPTATWKYPEATITWVALYK